MTVRVIEYYANVADQVVPEMSCLITDLTHWREHPAPELAALLSGGGTVGDRPADESCLTAPARQPGLCYARKPGPGPAGTRRLGRRHRDDPRRRP